MASRSRSPGLYATNPDTMCRERCKLKAGGVETVGTFPIFHDLNRAHSCVRQCMRVTFSLTYAATMPPSITRVVPVQKAASGEAR